MRTLCPTRRRPALLLVLLLAFALGAGVAVGPAAPLAGASAGSAEVWVTLDDRIYSGDVHMPYGVPRQVGGDVVRQDTRAGVPDLTVTVTYNGEAQVTTTDADGRFAVTVVPTVTGYLSVRAAAGPDTAPGSNGFRVVPEPRRAVVTGRLSAPTTTPGVAVTVSGTATVDGEALSGATVLVHHATADASAVTASDGTWSTQLRPSRTGGLDVSVSIAETPAYYALPASIGDLSVHAPPARLRGSLTPADPRPGQAVVAAGVLTRGDTGEAVAGAEVTVDWAGGSAASSTDPTGAWTVHLPAGATGAVHASTTWTSTLGGTRTWVGTIAVRPWATVFSGAETTVTRTSALGRRITTTGQLRTDEPVSPVRAGAPVELRFTDNRGAVTVLASGEADASGRYTLSGTVRVSGRAQAVAAAGADTAGAAGAARDVVVRRVVTVRPSATRVHGRTPVTFRVGVLPRTPTTVTVWRFGDRWRQLGTVRTRAGEVSLTVVPPRGRSVYAFRAPGTAELAPGEASVRVRRRPRV